MTKGMIDADILLAHLFELYKKDCENLLNEIKSETDKHWIRAEKRRGQYISKFIENMLETAPTTAPQESIFDINKWQNYLKSNGHEGVLYKILFGNQKTEQLMPYCSGGEILRAFDDNNFNPINNEFHKNIFISLSLEVKDFLCEPQESIFDAEGWCQDLSEAYVLFYDKDATYSYRNVVFNLKGYTEPLLGGLLESPDTDLGCAKQDFYIYDVTQDDYIIVNKDNFMAWRPLPKLPTGGEND